MDDLGHVVLFISCIMAFQIFFDIVLQVKLVKSRHAMSVTVNNVDTWHDGCWGGCTCAGMPESSCTHNYACAGKTLGYLYRSMQALHLSYVFFSSWTQDLSHLHLSCFSSHVEHLSHLVHVAMPCKKGLYTSPYDLSLLSSHSVPHALSHAHSRAAWPNPHSTCRWHCPGHGYPLISLDEGVKELLLEDAHDFLKSKQWYANCSASLLWHRKSMP